jgi:chromosome segregation ATPase
MALPSVIQGLIEAEDGKVFELDSPEGSAWLESATSFRFEPSNGSKACTVRKERSIYWYGCRKVAGEVRKKYIGKSPEVTVAKLEEAAAALGVPPVPRVKQVAEVAEKIVQVAEEVKQVAEEVKQVAETPFGRLAALELQVANLQKALEALQEALPGKLEPGDSAELPKVDSRVDNAVAEGLHNGLSNLKAENEKLKQELGDARTEVQELRSQLEAEKKSGKEREEEFWDLHEQWESSKKEVTGLRSELSDLKQKLDAARDFSDAADLLNQLKAKRKKSRTDLADVKAILEMIEKSTAIPAGD